MVGKGDNYWDAQQKQPTTNPYNCKASLTSSEGERREGERERASAANILGKMVNVLVV